MEAQTAEYQLTPSARFGGTGATFVIHVPPCELLRRYGMPISDNDSESLGTYVFTSPAGTVVTVYFRANDVWSLLLRLYRPLFWRRKIPVNLTVGASNDEEGLAFAKWLSASLQAPYRPWP